MSFSIVQLEEFFKDNEVDFQVEKDDNSIMSVKVYKGNHKGIVKICDSNPEIYRSFLYIYDEEKVLKVPKEHPNLKILLVQLMFINYETSFGSWEYDFNSGELRYAVEVPLIDSSLTLKQFSFIYENFYQIGLGSVDKIYKALNQGSVTTKTENDISLLFEEKVEDFINKSK